MSDKTDLNKNNIENSSIENGKTSAVPAEPPYYNPLPSPPPISWHSYNGGFDSQVKESSYFWLIILTLIMMITGLWFDIFWLAISSAIVACLLSCRVIFPSIQSWANKFLTPQERINLVAFLGLLFALIVIVKYTGIYQNFFNWLTHIQGERLGSLAEWVGALGQICIAVLAVYVAWEQYIISKDLTMQQNRITQQQTIDAYFQGVSDLALNSEGMLEDWPEERMIAVGRTAAILSSVDAEGKAKILRFLSSSKLITPLRRDFYLGRPILNGYGRYEEDRANGIRVINLGVILSGSNLAGQDLRWTDLSEAYLIRADLSKADLVKANLSRSVLCEANLSGADFKSVRLFYGKLETASPRSRSLPPDYTTGAHTGAVVEDADFTGVYNMNEEHRYYCCCWGGKKTRSTIPGGCEDIPNKLGR